MRYSFGMEITTETAAKRLNVSVRRVRAMIQAGRLPASRPGRDWLIKESSLNRVMDRPPGRPKKK
jgi:excisionase family DNA binding protein